jgi:serine/threonine protein kinase
MAVGPGQTLSHYRLVEKIGEGGMGVVYRAEDTKLRRQVALKVLPPELVANEERRLRFLREARTAAAVNHPNIAHVYEIDEADGVVFITMELVEGKTLRRQMGGKALPMKETLRIATEISEGLARAHQAHVIHRDLKPDNVMVAPDGHVKILDFGLAKLHEDRDEARRTELSHLETVSGEMTREGKVMGTPAYMSPEQARGTPVDTRSDLFAFGTTLYEMATGRVPFKGKTTTDTLSAIIRDESVPASQINAEIPPELDRIIAKCLEKDPAERYQHTDEMTVDLRHLRRFTDSSIPRVRTLSGSVDRAPGSIGRRPFWTRGKRYSISTVIGVLLIGASVWGWWFWPSIPFIADRRHPTEGIVRSFILPPENGGQGFQLDGVGSGSLTISPDGRYLTFSANSSAGENMLWIRPLDSLVARPIPFTEGGGHPFWSPDSRFIAFFSGGKLKKIDLAGSPPLILADAGRGRSGAWNDDGVILFSPSTLEPIYRISAAGGKPEQVTAIDKTLNETTHRFAAFLPDGRHFLYFAGGHGNVSRSETNAVFVADLESDEKKLLVHARSNASYADGYLLYVRSNVLLAHPFDPDRLEFIADPTPIAQNVQYEQRFFRALFSVSSEGTLVYRTGVVDPTSTLTWLDRAGKEIASIGEPSIYRDLAISPDETRAAVSITDSNTGTSDIWICDLGREMATRFTFGKLSEFGPLWSQDGERIVYSAITNVYPDLYIKVATGSGQAQALLESEVREDANSWTPDGKSILFTRFDPQSQRGGDMYMLELGDGKAAKAILQTKFDEHSGRLSPDGRWLAYVSDESGTYEVYVTPFPGPGGKWQISEGGGEIPVWTKNGTEILYRGAGASVMAVSIQADANTITVGSPVELFRDARITAADVSPTGERMLVTLRAEADWNPPLTVVTNWPAALRAE